MKSKKGIISVIIVLLSFTFVLCVFLYHLANKPTSFVDAFTTCKSFPSQTDAVLDCWYQVLHEYHNVGGVEAAFKAFNYLYETESYFADTGCHLHAHRIGDFAFYDSFMNHHNLDKLDFPDGSQVCGYGFYHGFIEHLVQDNPSPQYVQEVCDYFDDRLSDVMPLMRITCFHGSGHGFALATVDEGDMQIWGNYEKIIGEPLKLCSQLNANKNEVSECYEGVFNVLVTWMETGEYGLSYNYQEPFWLCIDLDEQFRRPCYYEMGQKIDLASQFDVQNALVIVSQIPDKDYIPTLLQLAVSNFLQIKASSNAHLTYIPDCLKVHDAELRSVCIRGLVTGVVEHGDPGNEQEKAVEICSNDLVVGLVQRDCYREVFVRLSKFYTKERIEEICNESGVESFKAYCTEEGYTYSGG